MTTTTGHGAVCTRALLTEPSSSRRTPPMPREPMTSRSEGRRNSSMISAEGRVIALGYFYEMSATRCPREPRSPHVGGSAGSPAEAADVAPRRPTGCAVTRPDPTPPCPIAPLNEHHVLRVASVGCPAGVPKVPAARDARLWVGLVTNRTVGLGYQPKRRDRNRCAHTRRSAPFARTRTRR